ncbi:MAG: EamA family transporter [Alphaproteobacteria bacterium]
MSTALLAALLALGSAVLHATWNALVKVRGDRLVVMALMTAVGTLFSLPVVLVAPDIDLACTPYLAGTVAVHTIYYWTLLQSYRFGDLSHAYPLARGSAPLLLALAAPFTLGETFSANEIVGIATISIGILTLVGWRRAHFGDIRAIGFPLATGVVIASYTTLDALGVRASGSPFGYVGWLFLLDGIVLPVYACARRPLAMRDALRTSTPMLVVGGLAMVVGYGMVLVALSFGSAAHVASLRETSVILAALIGTRLLGEPFGTRRIVAASLVVVGAIVLETGA